MINSLIIPLAGKGTRLRPITYAIPKEMVRLVDKPILWYLLAEAYQAGIREVIFVIHSSNRMTREFFESGRAAPMLEDFPGLATLFVETDLYGGDGQAILCAEPALSGTGAFAVTMGDLIPLPGTSLIAELVVSYETEDYPVISVENIPREKTGQYGVISPTKSQGRLHHVGSIVEKPAPEVAPSTFAMTGKYVLTPEIFTHLRALQAEGVSGELRLAHALDRLAHAGHLNAYECEAPHYDTGTKIDLLKAEIVFAKAHPEIGAQVQDFLDQ